MLSLHLILTATLAVGVFGDGEVIFLSKPPCVEFRGHEECDSSILKDICSTCLGFTTYQTNEWSGLYFKSFFKFAESVVILAIHGVASLDITEGHKFPFITDGSLDEIGTSLEANMMDRYPYSENLSFVEMNLEDDVRAAELNLNKGKLVLKRPVVSYLKDEEDIDSAFLSHIALLRAAVDKIQEKEVPVDGLPDVVIFSLKSLHPINDIYGENSKTALEAKNLVKSEIQHIKEVFDQAYKNKTLFLVVTSDSAHTRRFRRASEVASDLNLAPVYDENYPVMFNIFLWFTIAFIMAIIATSMVTAGMDPGRDSIIYRMTSTRMKKDN